VLKNIQDCWHSLHSLELSSFEFVARNHGKKSQGRMRQKFTEVNVKYQRFRHGLPGRHRNGAHGAPRVARKLQGDVVFQGVDGGGLPPNSGRERPGAAGTARRVDQEILRKPLSAK
jgi:hypothetical protein